MAVGRRTSRSPTRRSPRRSGRVRVPEQEAGDLLALEALDQSGLAVNSSGVFVRYLEVSPPNPLIMGEREREQLAAALRRLISRLRGGQWLQFYVETRPVQLGRLLERLRGEVRAFAGDLEFPQSPAARVGAGRVEPPPDERRDLLAVEQPSRHPGRLELGADRVRMGQ